MGICRALGVCPSALEMFCDVFVPIRPFVGNVGPHKDKAVTSDIFNAVVAAKIIIHSTNTNRPHMPG